MAALQVLLCALFLHLISEFCRGFDVCNNLINVEHELDKNGNVLACRYEILKFDPSGVFLREPVSTPVNKTLCHELRNADTCNPDGSLVTCHHVPEWERYPEGEFNPPEGCTFSQNLQCEMETICLIVTEKPVSEKTAGNMKTGRDKTTLNARTRFSTNRPVVVTRRTGITTGTEDTTTEKKEKSQHIVIDVSVKRLTTGKPSSTGNVNGECTFILILSLLLSLFLD